VEFYAVTAEIAKLELKDGDVLAVTIKGPKVSHGHFDLISDYLKNALGHNRFLIVNGNDVELSIIKAPASHVQD
jgi:hypothetical protein